jgi:hypothetical protein
MPSPTPLSPAFNDFLFATVCEERSETPLSVISALARLDLDPWTEAAALSRLPQDGAARRLSSLLASVDHLTTSPPDHATIAARLVALLPSPADGAVPQPVPSGAVATAAHFGLIRIMCLFLLGSMAVSVLLADLTPGAGAAAPVSGAIPSTATPH